MAGAHGQPIAIGGSVSTIPHARLDALKERHASLETRIADEDHRPRPNTDTLVRLKIEKLHIKEEMEKLRTRVN